MPNSDMYRPAPPGTPSTNKTGMHWERFLLIHQHRSQQLILGWAEFGARADGDSLDCPIAARGASSDFSLRFGATSSRTAAGSAGGSRRWRRSGDTARPISAPADAHWARAKETCRESAGLTECAAECDRGPEGARPTSSRTGDTLTSTNVGSAFSVSRQHTKQEECQTTSARV